MALLSQALRLGDLLPPHSAFQEHAAHPIEWPMALSSKGSSGTCIPEVFRHSSILLSRRSARWRYTTTRLRATGITRTMEVHDLQTVHGWASLLGLRRRAARDHPSCLPRPPPAAPPPCDTVHGGRVSPGSPDLAHASDLGLGHARAGYACLLSLPCGFS